MSKVWCMLIARLHTITPIATTIERMNRKQKERIVVSSIHATVRLHSVYNSNWWCRFWWFWVKLLTYAPCWIHIWLSSFALSLSRTLCSIKPMHRQLIRSYTRAIPYEQRCYCSLLSAKCLQFMPRRMNIWLTKCQDYYLKSKRLKHRENVNQYQILCLSNVKNNW